MQPLIYFTRHGQTRGEDALTEDGRGLLRSVRYQLNQRGFRPIKVLSSPTERALQTVEILAPGRMRNVHIVTDRRLEEYSTTIELSRYRRGEMVRWILSELSPYADMLVVSHDSYPAALALELIEQRGGAVDWYNLPEQVQLLPQGRGLLVYDKKYTYFAP